MDMEQISYFVEAAQTLSFRKVSQRYYTSQPSISNSISKLENELGAKLFNRTAHGVTLTAEGHEFLPYALQLLELTKVAVSKIRDVHCSNKGTITIACVPGASNVVSECLRACLQKYPEIYVDITVTNGYGQISAMDSDEYDFTFGSYQTPPHSNKSETYKIRDGHLALVLPRSQYPDPEKISFPDMAGVPFLSISPAGGPPLYDCAMECCKAHGFTPHIVSIYTDLRTILAAVGAGAGISVLPSNMLTGQEEDLTVIPFTGESSRLDVYFTWKKTTSNAAAVRFREVVMETMAAKKPGDVSKPEGK